MSTVPGIAEPASDSFATTPAETLDPQDWDAMRALAHRMVDDAISYLQTVEERPVWQEVPPTIAARFSAPAPHAPAGAEAAYAEFVETIFPYPMGNIHPRFWAWYMGNGTVMGALAELLAATMNSNLGGGNHVANLVEGQVIDWMKTIMGLPATASGLLVSGGSMANLVGLAVARNIKAGFDIRDAGLHAAPQALVIYTSAEAHSSIQKAVELLGLGSRNLRKISVNPDYTVDVTALAVAIAADRRAGLQPICVVGTSGTINTGAIDDLNALADLCAQENLWFHVDGAIGAVGMLAPTLQPRLAGIERADSVALDLHKWLHIPFEAGCVLVRHEADHRHTFSLTPEYLEHNTRGLSAGQYWFSDYGVQLSRQFRALKVWMSIKEHGLDRFGQIMERNVAQAHYLGARIAAEPTLELTAPIGLDIVCFRYNPGGLDAPALNALNKEILLQIHERGNCAPSYTTLVGRYSLRVAIANHRSRQSDFDLLLAEVLELGAALSSELTLA
ncbi:MAG: pyridoxal-dependent decarboxylase [Litorilinea sp.]